MSTVDILVSPCFAQEAFSLSRVMDKFNASEAPAYSNQSCFFFPNRLSFFPEEADFMDEELVRCFSVGAERLADAAEGEVEAGLCAVPSVFEPKEEAPIARIKPL